jgi:hypothetical protein
MPLRLAARRLWVVLGCRYAVERLEKIGQGRGARHQAPDHTSGTQPGSVRRAELIVAWGGEYQIALDSRLACHFDFSQQRHVAGRER